jgi:hypothetical protein
MNLPSLAEIFNQLIAHEDTAAVAGRIVDAMKEEN